MHFDQNMWWLEDHYWQADMNSVMDSHLDFIDKQKQESVSMFYGSPIKSVDGVYHPIEGSSTHFIGHALFGLIQPNTSLLEIGCGSGAISCTAAKLGVQRVLATDISKTAYECAQENVKTLGLTDKVNVIQSDLFSNVSEKKFDYIVFNAPLLHCLPIKHEKIDKQEYNEIAVDHNASTTLSFINQVKPYLNDAGTLLLTVSNIGDRNAVAAISDKLSVIGELSVLSAQYNKSGRQWRFVLMTQG